MHDITEKCPMVHFFHIVNTLHAQLQLIPIKMLDANVTLNSTVANLYLASVPVIHFYFKDIV